MLPLRLVEEVNRLLQEGKLSQRKIAKLLNVSRGTVSAIARGNRGIHGTESDDEVGLFPFDTPPVRCPGCGGMVYMPCLLCKAREYQRRSRLAAFLKSCSASRRRVA